MLAGIFEDEVTAHADRRCAVQLGPVPTSPPGVGHCPATALDQHLRCAAGDRGQGDEPGFCCGPCERDGRDEDDDDAGPVEEEDGDGIGERDGLHAARAILEPGVKDHCVCPTLWGPFKESGARVRLGRPSVGW